MAETAAASAIVPEFLNKDNYVEWTFSLVTYLMAQDLWDVIAEDQPNGLKEFLEAKGIARAGDFEDDEKANDKASKEVQSEAEIKAWLKKNASTLHVIIISCCKYALRAISGIISAKKAWKTLEAEYKPNSQDKLEAPITNTDENFVCKPFFNAVERDEWSCAQEFLSEHPEALGSTHPVSGKTALHIAVYAGNEQIMKELVLRMSEEDLEIQDNEGYTALLLAVSLGKTSIAKCMANKNRNLLGVTHSDKFLPVSMAMFLGNINLARYLYSITPQDYLSAEECFRGVELFVWSLHVEQYDIALDLLQIFPRMAISKAILADDESITLLEDMLTAFPTASRLNFWQQRIYDRINILATGNICVHDSNSEDSQITRRNITCSGLLKQFASNARKFWDLLTATVKTLLGIKHLYKMKLVNTCLSEVLRRISEEIKNLDDEQLAADTYISKAIIHAIAIGAVEFVVRLTNDQRLWEIRDKETGRNMFMIAVQYRREKIAASFIRENVGMITGNVLNVVDNSENGPVHMTGLLPPSSHLNIIPGPALQMQKEVQWFQEVESLIENKVLKRLRNVDGRTAQEYFTEKHEELRKKGEKWMKDTASSYSVVAALIVTMTFAAGFIIPGATNESMRSLSHKKWFLIFLISDAISLFSSTTSVLMSLGILTSPYYEEAFLTSLPTKLILGMSALFFSIATMMLCFCAALYEILQGQLWILIPIILLASVPVYLFARLQFPLLVKIFKSTYGSGLGIAPKKYKKHWFFW